MRVFLADDQQEVRSALRLLLEQEQGLSIIGEAAEAEGLLIQAKALRPDVVLLDWELPGQSVIGLLTKLHIACPNIQVIALSGRPEAKQAAMNAGADAFVSKGDPPEQVLIVIHSVGMGNGISQVKPDRGGKKDG